MVKRTVTRRRFISATGATTVIGLAGCLGGNGGDGGSGDGGDGGDGGSGTTTSGSTTSSSGGSGGGTIRYLTDRGDSKKIMDKIIAEFEGQSDYTVEATYTAHGNSTDQQMQKMIAAGHPPDIIFVPSSDAYRYKSQGKAASVTSAVKDNSLPDPVNVDGESYFAPAVVEPLMGWYRNDVYDSDPTTWNGWLDEAKRVSENTNMEGYVVQSGQTNNAETQMFQYLWNDGVNAYSGTPGDIKVEVDKGDNRQKAIESFQWIQEMAQYSPNGSGWEWGDAIGALQQENAAAIASVGGLPILSIGSNRPDLVDKLSPMAFPYPSGKSMDPWWAYMEGLVVRNDGDATDGAREFVDFFTKSSHFMDFVLAAPLFQFPPRKEQMNTDTFKNNETLNNHPDVVKLVEDNWDAFSTVLATGDGGAPNIVAANAYDQQVFGQAADQMLVGGKSPTETVDWLGQKLRSL